MTPEDRELERWQERAYRAEDLVEQASGTIGGLRAQLAEARSARDQIKMARSNGSLALAVERLDRALAEPEEKSDG